jgi:hypothetical protein
VIWSEDVEELETRLSHWERVSKKYVRTANKPREDSNVKTLRNGGRITTVEISGQEIKEIDRKFVYLGRVLEKNGKIQNEINERIGGFKILSFSKSLLWNKDIGRKCKIIKYNMCFKKILFTWNGNMDVY